MGETSVEVRVRYADWSDKARAGMEPASGGAGLTAALSDGGVGLYLERAGGRGLLHVELGAEEARELFEFLRGQFGGSRGGSSRRRRRCG
jgi:hypothetical protein